MNYINLNSQFRFLLMLIVYVCVMAASGVLVMSHCPVDCPSTVCIWVDASWFGLQSIYLNFKIIFLHVA